FESTLPYHHFFDETASQDIFRFGCQISVARETAACARHQARWRRNDRANRTRRIEPADADGPAHADGVLGAFTIVLVSAALTMAASPSPGTSPAASTA